MKKIIGILLILFADLARPNTIRCEADNINIELSNSVAFLQSEIKSNDSKAYENVSLQIKLPPKYQQFNASALVIYYVPNLYERLSLPTPQGETDPWYPKGLPSVIILTTNPKLEIENNILSFHLGGVTTIGLEAEIYISFSKGKDHQLSCLGDIRTHYKFGSGAN